MQRRTLGATGCEVGRLGLGLAALGRPAYINLGHDTDLGPARGVEDLARRSAEVLEAAVAAGVTYLDAARSYGRSEEFLARWLGGVDPVVAGTLCVASKWGYTYVGDWRLDADVHEVKDHGLVALDRQWAETEALLGSHLRLYQIHSATLDSGVLDDAEVLDRLAELRARHGIAVGLSTSGPGQGDTIRRALDVHRDGVALFATVQSTWNLLERSAGPALADAHDAGLGVIVKEALANGRLAGRDPGLAGRLTAVVAGAAAGGPDAGNEPSAVPGPDAVALAAVLAQPFVDVVLSGAATVGQLRANLLALTDRAASAAGAALDAVAPEDPTAYWAARSRLPWT